VLDTGPGQSEIIRQPPGGGIVIKSPTADDDGIYQCFARNDLGTAVTITTKVRRAGLDIVDSLFHQLKRSQIFRI